MTSLWPVAVFFLLVVSAADVPDERLELERSLREIRSEGHDALNAGEWERALSAFRRIVALDPHHPQAYLGLALLHARRGDLESAGDGLAALAPASGGPGRTYGMGVVRFLEGRLDEARSLGRQALQGYLAAGHAPGEASARTLLGNIHLRSGRLEKAVAEYRSGIPILESLQDRAGLADLLDNLGAVELRRGRLDEALVYQRQVLPIRVEIGDPSALAKTWNNLGLTLRRLDNHREAMDAFKRACDLHRRIGDQAAEGRCLNNLGLIHLDRKEIEAALEAFETAAKLARSTADRRAAANAVTNIGIAYEKKQEPDRAIAQHELALSIRKDLEDGEGTASSHENIARLLAFEGYWAEAVHHYERSLQIRREIGDTLGEAGTLLALADVLEKRGERERAMELLDESLQLFRRAGSRSGEAEALEELGNLRMIAGDLEGARQVLERSLGLRRETNNEAGEASALDRLGILHVKYGDFQAAEAALEASTEIAQRLGDPDLLASAWTDLSNLRLALGRPADALRLQRQALGALEEAGHIEGVINSLNNLGAIYHSIGKTERAVRYIREALQRAEALPRRALEALIRNNLAFLMAERGHLTEAMVHHRKSLEIRGALGDVRGEAYSRFNLGETLLRAGSHDAAAEAIEMALAVFESLQDPGGTAFALNGLGEVRRATGALRPAMESHRRALDIAKEFGLKQAEALARAGMAEVLEQRGDSAAALAEYLQAIDLVERIRQNLQVEGFKAIYLSRKLDLYERGIALLLELHEKGKDPRAAGRAFGLAERSRARSLLDLLAESRSDLRTGVDPELLRREAVLLGRMAAASARIRIGEDEEERSAARERLGSLNETLDLFKLELRSREARYGEIRYPEPVSLAEVQEEILREDEVLLEYFLGEDGSVLWAISPGGFTVRRLPAGAEITEQVESFIRKIRMPGEDLDPGPSVEEMAEKLAAQLIPTGLVTEGSRLVVVPDGALSYLPFEALRMSGGFLIETHEISYGPSATTLRILRGTEESAAPMDFLGVGDPAVEDAPGEFAPLPYSREEIRRVGKFFPETVKEVLLGRAATKNALRTRDLNHFRILHFATHAVVDEEFPPGSAILLSGDGGPAGGQFLSLNEIFAMRLDAELVVLSACSTGRGQLLRGEGLVGMTRAFLHAGARAVVVSLWNVNDRSTVDFMVSFYRRLSAGAEPVTALREAKMSFLDSDRPGYRRIARWAPFILIGGQDRVAGMNLSSRHTSQ